MSSSQNLMSNIGIMEKHQVDPKYSFLPSAKPKSSSWIWNGTNTITDSTKKLLISSRFPIDKSVIDASSESKETPPSLNHYSNSVVSLFPPAGSPDSSENYETTIPNPSIPSSFLPLNGQTALSIPSHFPPARSPDSFEDCEMTIPNPSIPSSFPQVLPPLNGQTAPSIPLHFPPARSPDSSEDCEMTNPNPSIPSSFPQVFPPPNGQTAHSIPLHFPPTISDSSSESNQTINGKTNLSNPLLFPAYKSETETDDSTSSESNQTINGKTNLSNPLLFPAYKSETETDDSTSSESNETFRTITSRQMVAQGSHLQQLLPHHSSKRTRQHDQMYCNSYMQQAQAVQTTNSTSSASSASGYEKQQQQLHQMLQTQMSFKSSKQQAQAAQSTGMSSFCPPVELSNISTSDPPSRDGQTQRVMDSRPDPKILGIIRHVLSKKNRVRFG